MEVNGDHVTMYGLAAEHTLQDGVRWNGEAGATYFYQFEFPYDVDQSYGDAGYVGYRVNSSVKQHHAWGVGVYHFFRDHPVVVKSAISTPPAVQDSFVSPLSVYLNGKGRVQHVINDDGGSTYTQEVAAHHVSWWCGDEAPAPAPPSLAPAAPARASPAPSRLAPAPVAKPQKANYSCRVGEAVLCPGAPGVYCAGNQCCPPRAPPARRPRRATRPVTTLRRRTARARRVRSCTCSRCCGVLAMVIVFVPLRSPHFPPLR
ncbi:unnamed protein product [Prorocentrum cordatum]|uniref:Uncharacterized protein n=1 Tax=Prorocentrum cordatum TaxID=2364126 RepID=A0ABN9UL20_9DINO|nr:unnamed protein product [Polarella glacialis]